MPFFNLSQDGQWLQIDNSIWSGIKRVIPISSIGVITIECTNDKISLSIKLKLDIKDTFTFNYSQLDGKQECEKDYNRLLSLIIIKKQCEPLLDLDFPITADQWNDAFPK